MPDVESVLARAKGMMDRHKQRTGVATADAGPMTPDRLGSMVSRAKGILDRHKARQDAVAKQIGVSGKFPTSQKSADYKEFGGHSEGSPHAGTPSAVKPLNGKTFKAATTKAVIAKPASAPKPVVADEGDPRMKDAAALKSKQPLKTHATENKMNFPPKPDPADKEVTKMYGKVAENKNLLKTKQPI